MSVGQHVHWYIVCDFMFSLLVHQMVFLSPLDSKVLKIKKRRAVGIQETTIRPQITKIKNKVK